MADVGQGTRYCVLGPVEALDDRGVVISLASARQRLLLAVLLGSGGQVVSTDALLEALWGDDQPADPRGSLQSQVWRLRQRLGPEAPLETTPTGYRLSVGARSDAEFFEQLVAEARRTEGDPAAALDHWDAALALWRGPAFFDMADHPALAARAAALRGCEPRAARHAPMRCWPSGAPRRRWRPPRCCRPRVRSGSGQWSCGCGPSPPSAASSRRCGSLKPSGANWPMRSDSTRLPSCGPSRPRSSVTSAAARATEAGSPRRLGAAGGTVVRPPTLAAPIDACVGRDAEIERLAELLEGARLVTVVGPGGVGKTRLSLSNSTLVAPNGLTSAGDRAPWAGTPWDKSVPARLDGC